VLSDKGLTTGVNYQIRTVWFQGGVLGEEPEELDDTVAQQGKGRAGRRGYDREATIYMSGVYMKNILMPTYKPVGRNNPDRMGALVEGEDEAFRRFVLTEERTVVATVVGAKTTEAKTIVTTIATEATEATEATTATTATTATVTATNETKMDLPDEETMKNMRWEDWA
jgi:hypothetical protein